MEGPGLGGYDLIRSMKFPHQCLVRSTRVSAAADRTDTGGDSTNHGITPRRRDPADAHLDTINLAEVGAVGRPLADTEFLACPRDYVSAMG